MGILNKLMFWKKDENEDFKDFNMPEMPGAGMPGEESHSDLGLPELGPSSQPPRTPYGEQAPPAFSEPTAAPVPTPMPPMSRMPSYQQETGPQLEIINSKLDAIKAILSAIDQRIASLERHNYEKRGW